MRTKGFIFCFLLGIIYMACDDTIGKVGLGIQPEEDRVNVFDTTVNVEARTIEVDSLYAKTVNGFLGELYDPSFGNIKSSYICQYYPSVGLPDSSYIINNKIDSVKLNISYFTYLGDSLAPMEVSIYPVIKSLDNHYYTNADPKGYCDMNNPLAKYSYTARNCNISDSVLKASGYFYYLSIPLSPKIGQDYLDTLNVRRNEGHEDFTLDEFVNYFKGTYITTTFGTGSMLSVYMTDITMYYTREAKYQAVDGSDSIENKAAVAILSVTKEVVQLNSFENKSPFLSGTDADSVTYLKSPAGIFTEITIPIKKIIAGIGKKKFSSVNLSLKAYPRDEWTYSFQFPGTSGSLLPLTDGSGMGYSAKLLLIEPDSVANFFEEKKVANSQTSYTTQFNSSSYSYDFNNIANVVQNAIDKAPDKDLKLWLIPVQTLVQSASYYTPEKDYMTSHYLFPSGVALKKGKNDLKIRVIATDLGVDD